MHPFVQLADGAPMFWGQTYTNQDLIVKILLVLL